jgi:hypothetical protein
MTGQTPNPLPDLAHFTGSESVYRHALARNIVYTEGAQYVAKNAGAYWLLDEVALNQAVPAIKRQEFQVWKLKVEAGCKATLTVEDGNYHVVWTKAIEFTDFPLPEFTFWYTNNTILLPSEY